MLLQIKYSNQIPYCAVLCCTVLIGDLSRPLSCYPSPQVQAVTVLIIQSPSSCIFGSPHSSGILEPRGHPCWAASCGHNILRTPVCVGSLAIILQAGSCRRAAVCCPQYWYCSCLLVGPKCGNHLTVYGWPGSTPPFYYIQTYRSFHSLTEPP